MRTGCAWSFAAALAARRAAVLGPNPKSPAHTSASAPSCRPTTEQIVRRPPLLLLLRPERCEEDRPYACPCACAYACDRPCVRWGWEGRRVRRLFVPLVLWLWTRDDEETPTPTPVGAVALTCWCG